MSNQETATEVKSLKELESLIEKALKKIGSKRESRICRYIPVKAGGYMHHFTMKKMKEHTPEELTSLIQEFIMGAEAPKEVPHKPRAARGSRKKRNQIPLNKDDWDKIINYVRGSGDKELAGKLAPKKSLAQVKKDLIASIKQGKIDEDQWRVYADLAKAQSLDADQANKVAPQIFALAEGKQ
jgi:hypothetical protein